MPYSPLRVNQRFGGTSKILLAVCFMFAYCFVYSLMLKMEASCSSVLCPRRFRTLQNGVTSLLPVFFRHHLKYALDIRVLHRIHSAQNAYTNSELPISTLCRKLHYRQIDSLTRGTQYAYENQNILNNLM
jgi:hypothetical protein